MAVPEGDAMIRRLNVIAGAFQVGLLNLLQKMYVEHGGLGPWLDEIEADLLKTVKSFESQPFGGDFQAEADAVEGGIEAITNFFIHARRYLGTSPIQPG